MVATLKKPKAKKALPDLSRASSIMQSTANHPDTDTILVFAGRLIEARAEIKVKRLAEKKIKQQAVNAGITLESLDEAMELGELGIDVVLERFQRLIHYAKALGNPIGEQLTLFANPADKAVSHEDLLKKAFDAGRILGLLGKNVDDQAYNPNTDLGQEHMKGWNDGQKVLMDQMVRNSEEAAAQAKRDAEAKAEKELERAAKAEAAKQPKGRKGKAVAAAQEAMAKLDDDSGEETTAVH
jgi:hypothetical protein